MLASNTSCVRFQAMDRCHRIGQTKPVMVYRLSSANSIESHVLKTAANKIALEALIIKKGEFKHEVTEVCSILCLCKMLLIPESHNVSV